MEIFSTRGIIISDSRKQRISNYLSISNICTWGKRITTSYFGGHVKNNYYKKVLNKKKTGLLIQFNLDHESKLVTEKDYYMI